MDELARAAADLEGMRLQWSPIWRPEWAWTPEAYVSAELVLWEGNRRLLRGDDDALGLRVYLGVRASDPSRWGAWGEPQTRFFASALLGKRTLFLRTYPDALAALADIRNIRLRLAEAR
ncbi:MAG TPA: hypothetical protein VF808_14155 [Ktedonobacterales bacterium]